MDKIRDIDLRTKIFENISRLSSQGKRCYNPYLYNNFLENGFKKYEISRALVSLEEKGNIYKIIYIDWYIKERYRKNDIKTDDKLMIEIFVTIKNFSSRSNWKYGLKRTDLYTKLLEKKYSENDIRSALESMERLEIIYKKIFVYWFTYEYKKDIIDKGIIWPDNIEENDIEKIEYGDIEKIEYGIEKTEIGDGNMEEKNIDIPGFTGRIIDRCKNWKKLDDESKNLVNERDKKFDRRKSLEQEMERLGIEIDGLDVKIEKNNKEKEDTEIYFRLLVDAEKEAEEKKGLKT